MPRCTASRRSAQTSWSVSGPGSEGGVTIEGLTVRIGPEAVVIVAAQPLRVLSSAVHGGGLASARAVVTLQVGRDDPCADPAGMLAAYARRAGVPEPFVGLLTGAWTEAATMGEEDGAGIPALAVATVGLSNATAAGRTPGTINIIVWAAARPAPAAVVNAVITVTEVKPLLLQAAGVCDSDGGPVS